MNSSSQSSTLSSHSPPPPPSIFIPPPPLKTDIPQLSSSVEKKTWIVTQNGVPTHIIPFNKVEEVSKLNNIQTYEVAFPIHYTFKLGKTLKEACGVFLVFGESILPVINQDNQIFGTLSIFSVPKPEKEHSKTKEVESMKKRKLTVTFLTQKLIEKRKKTKEKSNTSIHPKIKN